MIMSSQANKTKSLFRPPTRDELQNAKETEHLYGSNLTKLQVSELLTEVSPRSHPPQLDDLLITIKNTLKSLPCSDTVKLNDAITLLHEDVQYPLSFSPPSSIKGQFRFLPPKRVSITGSFLVNTQLNKSHSVDLTLCMSEECLQPKDLLNYRYFHKRAIHLAIIAGHLKATPTCCREVQYSADNPLLPVIILTPSDPGLAHYTVVIRTAIPEGYFPLHKLYPNRNNVRVTTSEDVMPPTPHYNASLLWEMGGAKRHLEDLYTSINDCPAIREAILLFRVWAKQREMNQKSGCFTAFHYSMLMVYLLRQRKISDQLSSYQLLIVALRFIAETDLTTNGISIADRKQFPTLPDIALYHDHYETVFLDSSGVLNMCAHVSRHQYYWLRREARESLQLQFESLFLKAVPFIVTFDGVVRVDIAGVKRGAIFREHEWALLECDNRAWLTPCVAKKLVDTIERGFHGRVNLIGQDGYQYSKWPISDIAEGGSCEVTLGFSFEGQCPYNDMTIGPPANDPQAVEFRGLWGDVCEVRRFQDGSIHECVQWEGQGRGVAHQILTHLLGRHVKVSPDCIMSNMNCKLDSNILEDEIIIDGMGKALTDLRRILHSIKSLPLSITSVQCSSGITSRSEIPCAKGVCEVVIQLESSNKWPCDITAILGMITLYYTQLHHILTTKHSLMCIPTTDYIDINKGNHVFRVRVYHPLLLQLMKKATPPSVTTPLYEYKCVNAPRVSAIIAKTQGVWPSYGPGSRLCKKWLSAHLLSGHLLEQVVDLLIATVFVNPQPFSVPNSPVGVLYRFLLLIMSHDWSHDPFIINIDGAMSDAAINEVKTQYERERSRFPCMGVVSHLDPQSLWTRNKPVYPVMRRLILLAKTSMDFIRINSFSKSLNIKQIFRSPLADYDVLFHLKPNLHLRDLDSTFDPVTLLLDSLETNYSEYALFFYDRYGEGQLIALLWKPKVKELRPFKPSDGYCLVPSKESYKVNIKTLIKDMAILGEGIIDSIQ